MSKPIIVFNDTKKPLTVRQNLQGIPPSVVNVAPQKQFVLFMRSDEIFCKIWEDNVVLFQDVGQKLVEMMPLCREDSCIHWENGDCAYGLDWRKRYCEPYKKMLEKDKK